jgi:BirA family biotin operon repressor/biotin-[acetyl-CoA-carboxylase] ligase
MNLRAEWTLDTRHIGRRVLLYDALASTNTHAAALADDPTHDGTVIVADHQTAGRGQHGRTWQCPAGDGLLLSVLLFPPPALRRPALLTAWAAVSVCETIRQTAGLQARIKWPNDVLVRGKKVCGILMEQGRGTVAGIGLNVNQSAASLAQAGLPLAGSLAALTGRRLERDQVLRTLVTQMDGEYDRLRQGDRAGLEACWQWRVGLLGRPVVAECLDGAYHGRLVEMSLDGLVLQLGGGRHQHLPPESVRHLNPVAPVAD